MHPEEIQRVQNFLTTKFRRADIKLKPREETDDSVEFIIDGETLGIVFKDDEDGDICYHVQMTILSEDIKLIFYEYIYFLINYLFVKFASLFSINANIPSFWSAVENIA